MASVASDLMGRMKKVWHGLSPTVRWLSLGLLLALVLSLGVAWYLQRPQWKVFYKASDSSEVTDLTARLDELKVPYRLTGDGLTLEVQSSDTSAANLAKAQAGVASGGNVGLEIFAEPKFGATEFDKKVNYERAAEGELARALMRISDIQHAVVNLNMPEKSVFVRDQEAPSASVLVEPKSGRTLSKENVRAVMSFVSSAVEGLTPERVTVLNNQGVELSKGLANMEESAGADPETIALQRQREQELTEKVMKVLEPVFGKGNVAATVMLEYDHQTTRTEERIVGQSVPKSSTTERSGTQTQSSGNGGTAGTTGTDTTVTPPPTYQAQQQSSGASESYTTKSDTQYDVGEKNQVTVSPAGSVKRVSTAVTINREELTQAQVDQIRQLAANATGATMGDVSVVAMSFTLPADDLTQTAATQPKALLDPKALAIGLGIASFLLIIAFVMARRRRPEPEFALPGGASYPATGTTLDVALGLGEPHAQQAAAMAGPPRGDAAAAEAKEAPSAEQQTVAKKLEEVLKKRKPPRQTLEPEDFADDDILVDIDVLIQQAPEACTEVIRQWLKGGL